MNFSQLTDHLREECACTVEHLEDNIYIAKNCINAEMVIIEDIPFYESAYLAYMFHTLKVGVPEELEDFIHVFDTFSQKKNPLR